MTTSTLEQPSIFFKIVLVGESGVGKTNILSRYINNKFFVAANTTIGVEFSTKIVQMHGKDIKIALWDTCGQQRYRALASIFYKGAVGACVIFDLGAKSSFISLGKWLKELADQTPNGVVLLLIGNKCDLESREVTTQEALKLAQEHKMAYMQTSAAKGTNINAAFQKLIEQIYCNFQKTSELGNSKLSNEQQIPIQPNLINLKDKQKQKNNKKKCCSK